MRVPFPHFRTCCIPLLFFIPLFLFAQGCSPTPRSSFEEMRSAACDGDWEEFSRYIDFEQITAAASERFLESRKPGDVEELDGVARNNIRRSLRENLMEEMRRGVVERGKESSLCRSRIVQVEKGDDRQGELRIRLPGEEGKEFSVTFRRDEDRWLLTDVR